MFVCVRMCVYKTGQGWKEAWCRLKGWAWDYVYERRKRGPRRIQYVCMYVYV